MKKFKTTEGIKIDINFIEWIHKIILNLISIIFMARIFWIQAVTGIIEKKNIEPIMFHNFLLFLFIITICYFLYSCIYKYITDIEPVNNTYKINKNNLIEISLNKNIIKNEYYIDYIILLIDNEKYKINSNQFIFLHNSSNFAFLTSAKQKHFNKKLIIDKFFISIEISKLFEERINDKIYQNEIKKYKGDFIQYEKN